MGRPNTYTGRKSFTRWELLSHYKRHIALAARTPGYLWVSTCKVRGLQALSRLLGGGEGLISPKSIGRNLIYLT